MFKYFSVFLLLASTTLVQAQSFNKEIEEPKQDSLNKRKLLKSLGNGYLPSKYFDADLRYLIKYNQYEGVRTGIGIVTNKAFSEKYRLNSYGVYGFRDHRFKYSLGGGIRLAEQTNTWLNLTYTDDLQETGSTKFLTDKRFFQFFEPRLLNISLFHKHITKSIALEHEINYKWLAETEFTTSKIEPTYAYGFNVNGNSYQNFDITSAKIALQWSPFNTLTTTENNKETTNETYPKFSFQYTKSFKNVLGGDFNFSKLDFRTLCYIGDKKNAFSEATIVFGLALGDLPLTHLYHAYPNNINKEKILQRFSVAGLNSFETMFFNEFFSDRFTTLQFKHFLKPFNISKSYQPQLVLITRYAIGDMKFPERHENITFSSLEKGYTESGFELNKLLFGFGLSFTYRYGAYHLPSIDDNVAFKFTFNITL